MFSPVPPIGAEGEIYTKVSQADYFCWEGCDQGWSYNCQMPIEFKDVLDAQKV